LDGGRGETQIKARGSAEKVESGHQSCFEGTNRDASTFHFMPRRNMSFSVGTCGVKLTRAINIGKIVVYRI
jgi:hypothetical protein